MGPVPAGYHGSMTDYAALKKAGAPVLGWGEFVTEVVSFLILAFIIFLMVRWATKLMRKPEEANGRPDRGRAAGRNQGRAEAALKPNQRFRRLVRVWERYPNEPGCPADRRRSVFAIVGDDLRRPCEW